MKWMEIESDCYGRNLSDAIAATTSIVLDFKM